VSTPFTKHRFGGGGGGVGAPPLPQESNAITMAIFINSNLKDFILTVSI
jgi:hypothetical protein